jgi:hypothetical protein
LFIVYQTKLLNIKKITIMKKLTVLFAVAFAVVGSAFAQMAIPGRAFADNPSRFNGRKVTVKEIKVDFTNAMNSPAGAIAPAPIAPGAAIGMPQVAPGANGAGNVAVRCNPPRGFSKVAVSFNEAPNFQACFFMADAMYNQLKREAGGQSVDAQITFRGDSRTGYNVSFYRLGR